MRTTRLVSWGAIIVISLLLMPLTASTQGTDPSMAATPGGATPETAIVEHAPFTTTDNAWEIEVTDVMSRSTLRGDVAKGVYVIVFLDVTNTSRLEDSFPYEQLAITDASGTEYSRDSGATNDMLWSTTGDGASRRVDPGETIQTAVVFDVATDAIGLELSGPAWPAPVDIDRYLM